MPSAAPHLIVALDVPTADRIAPLLDQLPPGLLWYKVGLELFTREGEAALRPLLNQGKRIFLDLKFHDIPRTAARAVESASRLGVAMLTLHASGGRAMVAAAAEAARRGPATAPRLIAVTTLTSLNDEDLRDLGICRSVREQAVALGELALSAGADGLVTSVHEAAELRARFGQRPILVTPGIRPAGIEAGDQKRIATPAAAVAAGASFLVVGRPILDAANPGQAAEAILEEIAEASRALPQSC
jgi:orotidine-5'-phosphate decarboxylase